MDLTLTGVDFLEVLVFLTKLRESSEVEVRYWDDCGLPCRERIAPAYFVNLPGLLRRKYTIEVSAEETASLYGAFPRLRK
jgi:hypothetical protein